MKRKSTLCALLTGAAVLLAACGGQKQTMWVGQSQLGEETSQAIALFAPETHLFSYAVDDSIASIVMTAWHYEDGTWNEVAQSESPVNGSEEQEGTLAVQCVGDTCKLFWIQREWDGWSSCEAELDFQLKQEMNQCDMLEEYLVGTEEEIVADQEIPLWTWIGGERASAQSPDFRQSDCDAGIAVTVTFASEKLEGSA